MPIQHVWSDEYNGPAYHYYSPYRPVRPTVLPEGTVVILIAGSDPKHLWVTAPLPEHYIKQADLESWNDGGCIHGVAWDVNCEGCHTGFDFERGET